MDGHARGWEKGFRPSSTSSVVVTDPQMSRFEKGCQTIHQAKKHAKEKATRLSL